MFNPTSVINEYNMDSSTSSLNIPKMREIDIIHVCKYAALENLLNNSKDKKTLVEIYNQCSIYMSKFNQIGNALNSIERQKRQLENEEQRIQYYLNAAINSNNNQNIKNAQNRKKSYEKRKQNFENNIHSGYLKNFYYNFYLKNIKPDDCKNVVNYFLNLKEKTREKLDKLYPKKN